MSPHIYQSATLLEITCHGSYIFGTLLPLSTIKYISDTCEDIGAVVVEV